MIKLMDKKNIYKLTLKKICLSKPMRYKAHSVCAAASSKAYTIFLTMEVHLSAGSKQLESCLVACVLCQATHY